MATAAILVAIRTVNGCVVTQISALRTVGIMTTDAIDLTQRVVAMYADQGGVVLIMAVQAQRGHRSVIMQLT